MRHISLALMLTFLLISCGQNDDKQGSSNKTTDNPETRKQPSQSSDSVSDVEKMVKEKIIGTWTGSFGPKSIRFDFDKVDTGNSVFGNTVLNNKPNSKTLFGGHYSLAQNNAIRMELNEEDQSEKNGIFKIDFWEDNGILKGQGTWSSYDNTLARTLTITKSVINSNNENKAVSTASGCDNLLGSWVEYYKGELSCRLTITKGIKGYNVKEDRIEDYDFDEKDQQCSNGKIMYGYRQHIEMKGNNLVIVDEGGQENNRSFVRKK